MALDVRARPMFGRAIALMAIASLILMACQSTAVPVPAASVPSPSVVGVGMPAPSCAGGVWAATLISCEAVFRIGDQAGARVDRARVWLTTLGAVKEAMHPRKQVAEPGDAAEVWTIVYDGFWRCCPHAFDQNGNTIPLVDQTTWLVVADAAKEGTGFIYLQDWSALPVPDRLPPPAG